MEVREAVVVDDLAVEAEALRLTPTHRMKITRGMMEVVARILQATLQVLAAVAEQGQLELQGQRDMAVMGAQD